MCIAQAKGDNDPLDAVEMGLIPMKTGEVKRVRVLGVLALIDNGETDWKIITISVDDLLADRIHTLDELECVLPGAVGALREWLRNYKVCTGKPEVTPGSVLTLLLHNSMCCRTNLDLMGHVCQKILQ